MTARDRRRAAVALRLPRRRACRATAAVTSTRTAVVAASPVLSIAGGRSPIRAGINRPFVFTHDWRSGSRRRFGSNGRHRCCNGRPTHRRASGGDATGLGVGAGAVAAISVAAPFGRRATTSWPGSSTRRRRAHQPGMRLHDVGRRLATQSIQHVGVLALDHRPAVVRWKYWRPLGRAPLPGPVLPSIVRSVSKNS